MCIDAHSIMKKNWTIFEHIVSELSLGSTWTILLWEWTNGRTEDCRTLLNHFGAWQNASVKRVCRARQRHWLELLKRSQRRSTQFIFWHSHGSAFAWLDFAQSRIWRPAVLFLILAFRNDFQLLWQEFRPRSLVPLLACKSVVKL